ncbi:MAG TPA: PIN domain-containing protein [Euryarchaeota archaeon]|nr:PIN domain-containing protein [Euryarchaeota archaeon]
MLLDTSIIVDLLKGDERIVGLLKKEAQKEPFFLSLIQLGELADWALANGLDPLDVIDTAKKAASAVDLTEEICLSASRTKRKQRKRGKGKFSLIDGIIAATAASIDQKLLTRDRDFDGLENAIIIE